MSTFGKAKESFLGRGLGMGMMGFKLAGSYLGYQLQNLVCGEQDKAEKQKQFQKRASHQVCESLKNLKGPLMKIGQVLSMQDHILPREVIDELATLQMSAPAMHPTLARAQFKASFGRYPDEVFKQMDPKPFAAASLGQVHHAVTKSGGTGRGETPVSRNADGDQKRFQDASIRSVYKPAWRPCPQGCH